MHLKNRDAANGIFETNQRLIPCSVIQKIRSGLFYSEFKSHKKYADKLALFDQFVWNYSIFISGF